MNVIDAYTHIFPPEIIRRRDGVAQKDEGFAIIYKDRASKTADADVLFAHMETNTVDACVVCGFPSKTGGMMCIPDDRREKILYSNARRLFARS